MLAFLRNLGIFLRFDVKFGTKMIVKLTTHLSMYCEGGPPFLVLGPSGAVQIGKGTLVLP